MDACAPSGVVVPVVWTGPPPHLGFGVVLEELHRAGGELPLVLLAEALVLRCRAFTAGDLGDMLEALEVKRFIRWNAEAAWLLPGFGVR